MSRPSHPAAQAASSQPFVTPFKSCPVTVNCHGMATRRSRMYQLKGVPSLLCVCWSGVDPARCATAADAGYSGSTWITASAPPSPAAYSVAKL